MFEALSTEAICQKMDRCMAGTCNADAVMCVVTGTAMVMQTCDMQLAVICACTSSIHARLTEHNVSQEQRLAARETLQEGR